MSYENKGKKPKLGKVVRKVIEQFPDMKDKHIKKLQQGINEEVRRRAGLNARTFDDEHKTGTDTVSLKGNINES